MEMREGLQGLLSRMGHPRVRGHWKHVIGQMKVSAQLVEVLFPRVVSSQQVPPASIIIRNYPRSLALQCSIYARSTTSPKLGLQVRRKLQGREAR
jgi:hypothetical protein